MKLNHDCMRDCLMYLEAKTTVQIGESEIENEFDVSLKSVTLATMFSDMESWANQDIFYAVFNLHQGGYLSTSIDESDTGTNFEAVSVHYITLQGHEFLDSIRDNERWRSIKNGLSAVRNYSLSAISAVAEGLTAGAISAFLAQRGETSAP